MTNTSSRGFTLIELLVAISIIGILSSIIMGSVTRARSKGHDAAAKADLGNIRAQAILYYDNNAQSYGTADTACSSLSNVFDPTAANNIAAQVSAAEGAVNNTATCANDDVTYAVAIPLLSGDVWCIDSTGYASSTDLALTGIGSVSARIACQ
ncbi:MAG: prepilin-type N-terminal cleavage/methylation domain-containing protein [Patescibacteria group bacterium]